MEQSEITPFLNLVKQWSDAWHKDKDNDFDLVLYVALQAFYWGAAQELDACCEWLISNQNPRWATALQEGRRPSPSNLKKQALEALEREEADSCSHHNLSIIRTALESLPE